MAQHQILDKVFDVVPEPTPEPETPNSNKTVIEVAADLLDAEILAESTSANLPSPTHDVSSVPAIRPAQESDIDQHNKALQEDLDQARLGIKTALAQAESATQSALELAEAGEKPGAYRVVGELINATVSANRELVNIHKIKKDAEKVAALNTPANSDGNVNIDKAVFVGRASDLLRELKKARKGTANGS